MASKDFQKYLSEIAGSFDEPMLPLMHTTDAYALRSILRGRTIEKFRDGAPAPIPAEQSALLYLFYGRPCYKITDDRNVAALPAFLPVCLVLRPDAIAAPTKLFPFDTGAFQRDLYARHLHRRMTLENFELEPDLNSVPRLVSRFFGSNKDYFLGTPKSGLNIPPFHFEAQAYYNILRDEAAAEFDDRRGTIEIQLDHSLVLTRDTVLAVAMPTVFLDEAEVRNTILGEWRAQPLTYEIHNLKVAHYTSQIYSLVKSFLKIES